MYFTIPANYGGGSTAARTIMLDKGISLEYKPTTLKYSFGDGQSLTVPTGPEKLNFSGIMSNREKTEIDAIVNYFTFLKGQKIYGFNILDTPVNIKVVDFNVTWINTTIGSIDATFDQVYDGTVA